MPMDGLTAGFAARELNELLRGGRVDKITQPERDTIVMLIRTGGEKRLSNFLLYQCAYSELYFCDTLWPDFDRSELMAAIEDYSKRKRRFGR